MILSKEFRTTGVLLLLAALLLAGCADPIEPVEYVEPVDILEPIDTVEPANTAEPTDGTSGDVIALVNGRLIDGTGAEPLPGAVLVIWEGRITAIGGQETIEIPKGAQVIDVAGGTILPGFINAHVHEAFEEKNLIAWAQGGVTTVRDEGILSRQSLEDALALRDTWNNDPQSARLISAGYILTVPGGYGLRYVTSPADAREKVLDELAAGVDLIKLSMEDGYDERNELPTLSDEELEALISTAHEGGVLVSGHITQTEYLEILVEAGVDDIAHVPYDEVPGTTWQRIVAKDIYMTPTFTVYRNYNAPVSICVDNLRNFVAQGGKVALGNDYGGGPGNFELGIPMYEIEKMSEAGMTPMQIIVASTLNAAHVSGIEKQVGTLEPGKIADVLVVQGDPLQDLEALRNIRLVIHEGVIIRDESR